MRKTLVLGLSIFMVASLYGTASAWTLRVRHDPRETQLPWDIRKVSSDLTAREKFCSGHHLGKVEEQGLAQLRPGHERDEGVRPHRPGGVRRHHAVCAVFSQPEGGHLIGFLRPNRPNPRTIGCVIPRSWFPRIRYVRFRVGVYGRPDYRLDRPRSEPRPVSLGLNLATDRVGGAFVHSGCSGLSRASGSMMSSRWRCASRSSTP